jgi:hypothetical protein
MPEADAHELLSLGGVEPLAALEALRAVSAPAHQRTLERLPLGHRQSTELPSPTPAKRSPSPTNDSHASACPPTQLSTRCPSLAACSTTAPLTAVLPIPDLP